LRPTSRIASRFEDPERQARYASVFSIVAGAFVPLNFIAVRLAQQYVHARVLTPTGGTCRARCG
jgi:heme exporter protein C